MTRRKSWVRAPFPCKLWRKSACAHPQETEAGLEAERTHGVSLDALSLLRFLFGTRRSLHNIPLGQFSFDGLPNLPFPLGTRADHPVFCCCISHSLLRHPCYAPLSRSAHVQAGHQGAQGAAGRDGRQPRRQDQVAADEAPGEDPRVQQARQRALDTTASDRKRPIGKGSGLGGAVALQRAAQEARGAVQGAAEAEQERDRGRQAERGDGGGQAEGAGGEVHAEHQGRAGED
mmetsp:Transcript_36533/g.88828  ORF Transcript_36533/g.88828 Transcript_36533/m.88828 type:complete len:232 (+) Transcript_36533:159-854(+)